MDGGDQVERREAVRVKEVKCLLSCEEGYAVYRSYDKGKIYSIQDQKLR